MSIATHPLETEPRADAEHETPAGRAGGVALWALAGAAWVAFAAQAWGRWILSDEFEPAPIRGPDKLADGWLVVLRVIEIASLAIAVATIWVFLVKPFVRTRKLQLDGMIVIGALLASAIDPLINYFHYTFAWNAHALNVGSWLAFFPNSTGPRRYGEGLAWYVPQYLYLGIGLAAIECRIILALRRRAPSISNVRSFSIAALVIFALDIAIEQLFIRTHVYAFPRTYEALTLWPGSEYQFPVYESIFVAAYAAGFTALRMSAYDALDGRSFVERGVERIRPRLQMPVRTLAVCGFCAVWAALAYFIPWSWMSVNADSFNRHVPSYMLPGDAEHNP
jgi:hypothetical protein